MKIPSLAVPREAEHREIVGGPPSRPPEIPFLVDVAPTDSRFVQTLKNLALPERAWYTVAVGLAKYIEVTRGRRRAKELDRLYSIVAFLTLNLVRSSSERLERWPGLLRLAYNLLSEPSLQRGRPARVHASSDDLRRYMLAAQDAISEEQRNEKKKGSTAASRRETLTRIVARVYLPGAIEPVDLRIAEDAAALIVANMTDDEVEDIVDSAGAPAEAARELIARLVGYTEDTLDRKMRRRTPSRSAKRRPRRTRRNK